MEHRGFKGRDLTYRQWKPSSNFSSLRLIKKRAQCERANTKQIAIAPNNSILLAQFASLEGQTLRNIAFLASMRKLYKLKWPLDYRYVNLLSIVRVRSAYFCHRLSRRPTRWSERNRTLSTIYYPRFANHGRESIHPGFPCWRTFYDTLEALTLGKVKKILEK